MGRVKVRGKSRKHPWEGAGFKKCDKRRFPGEVIRRGGHLPDIFSLPWQLLQTVLQCTCSWWVPCRWWFLGNKPHCKNKWKELSSISRSTGAFPNISNLVRQACQGMTNASNSPRRGYLLETFIFFFFFFHYTLLFQLQDGPIILVEFCCPDSDSGQALLCIYKL